MPLRIGALFLALPSRAFHKQLYSTRFGGIAAAFAFSSTTSPLTAAAAASTRSSPDSTTSSRQYCTTMSSEGEFRSRSVDQVVLSREQAEGQGARVRRSIGSFALRNFDPFLMLDEFDVATTAGFPDHPHRGFETVTYMLKGIMEHEDFCGHRGKIGPGSLQWMTAGKGIVHAEMPTGPDRGHGLQLWVNLKSADKMVSPAYQELNADEIPRATKDGVTAIVIAGEALGISSPVQTRTPTHYIHFKMEPGSELRQPIPTNMNGFLYILEGKAAVGSGGEEKDQIQAHNTVTLTKGGSGVQVKTFDSPADFVLVCGEPTNEPVVQHGPFVMNTRQEIQEAMLDYQSSSNGFENASKWYSEIGLPMTHADRRR
ncbi:unnamed protein product [Ectocarpus sp. CCAP 1310/34]|nr:unnamed protein product [Ectocarpus sp. CCAP 1310/34]